MTVGGGLAVWDNLSTHLSCENAKVNDNVTALAQQVSTMNKQPSLCYLGSETC